MRRTLRETMRAALVSCLVLAAATPRSAGACDDFIIESKVFEFASRGGILVHFRASPTKGPAYEAPLVNKKWRFKLANRRVIQPKAKLIAPGLAVLTLPAGVPAGVLVDGEKRIAELDAISESEPRLQEPRVRAVVRTAMAIKGKPPTSQVVVEIVGQVPRTAVAIVLADAGGDPMTFGMIEPGQPLVVFESKECTVLAPGTVEPRAGQRVKAFWVDQFGRVSPRSEPIKVIDLKDDQDPTKDPKNRSRE